MEEESENDDKTILECYIDKIKLEEDKEIGFDLDLLKRRELNVNLIYFDLNMTRPENYSYYNDFKVDVVGGFLAMDDLIMFQKYLEEINKKNIPFIVITSGSSGKDVIEICQKYSFVREVIIFCGTIEYNEHYIKDYPYLVKRVFNRIKKLYDYIETFGETYKPGIQNYRNSSQFLFSYEDIKMDNQLELCPVISAYEYDKCYFLVHRAYAHFFGDINNRNENVIFTRENFKKINDYINSSEIIGDGDKKELISKFESIVDKINFVELSIRKYTGESSFCYIFNRTMRNFDSGLISLAYYMGPLLYALNKYVKENPQNFSFSEDMTLYRNIQCSIYDFYIYKMNLNHIICFPAITSTCAGETKFKPTKKAKKINNNGINPESMVNLKMIFKYKHEEGNISPGIIIKDYLGSDGKCLSTNPKENEVILFPFTFVRITNIEPLMKNTYAMHLDIINRKEYIEYKLKKDVQNRIFFGVLDEKYNNQNN